MEGAISLERHWTMDREMTHTLQSLSKEHSPQSQFVALYTIGRSKSDCAVVSVLTVVLLLVASVELAQLLLPLAARFVGFGGAAGAHGLGGLGALAAGRGAF